MPDTAPAASPLPPAPPSPPAPPDIGREIAEQTRQLTENINRKVAERLAEKNRELVARDNERAVRDNERAARDNERAARDRERAEREKDRAREEHSTSRDGGGGNSIIIQTPRPAKSKSSEDDYIVPVVFIVFLFGFLTVKAIAKAITSSNASRPGPGSALAPGFTGEELALVQKIQKTLSRMESRVEALETILNDPSRSQAKSTRSATVYESKS